jgi:hypothetical protein
MPSAQISPRVPSANNSTYPRHMCTHPMTQPKNSPRNPRPCEHIDLPTIFKAGEPQDQEASGSPPEAGTAPKGQWRLAVRCSAVQGCGKLSPTNVGDDKTKSLQLQGRSAVWSRISSTNQQNFFFGEETTTNSIANRDSWDCSLLKP